MGRSIIIGLATALSILLATGATMAGEMIREPRAVVELFTSQGCSSCPPADKLLAELARKGEVVALAYHVDYWDYLGWKDTLATPKNTERQHEYGRAFKSRSVYTPQAVINGRTHVNGAKRGKVKGAIEKFADTGRGMMVDVSVSYTEDKLIIETGAAPQPVDEAQIIIVYVNAAQSVDIAAGDNEGRSVSFWNSVSDFHTAGTWDGKPTRIELPMSEIVKRGAGGCAVLVQELREDGLPGPILGATMMMKPYRL